MITNGKKQKYWEQALTSRVGWLFSPAQGMPLSPGVPHVWWDFGYSVSLVAEMQDPSTTCQPWTSLAPALAFCWTWNSVWIVARSCLFQGFRIQSVVLAVASLSMCETLKGRLWRLQLCFINWGQPLQCRWKKDLNSRCCCWCGHDGMAYHTRQMHSSNKGQTVFYSCTNCKFQEKEDSWLFFLSNSTSPPSPLPWKVKNMGS